MWTYSYHRFADEAAFNAACEAEGWIQADMLVTPSTVALDPLGAIEGEPAGFYVMAAWMSDQPAAFAASVVVLENPPRVWAA
jgi:hypothetical protein